MSGFGVQPAGTSPAGYGTSAQATAPAGAILRNAQTGEKLSVRKIDPLTRDYVLDDYGRILGANYVQHCVQMAVHTEEGSSAVKGLGQKLRTLDRITPNFERQVLATLTAAVQVLVDLGYVEVLGFSTFVAGDDRNGLRRGAIYGRFRWRDLTTTREYTELI